MDCLTSCCGRDKNNLDKEHEWIINQSNNKQNIINKVKTFTIKANEKNVK